MPTGKVKFYDADKGFGFIHSDDGEEVFVHASSLPAGTTLKAGTRVEFGVVDGRRGKQVLSLTVVGTPASVVKATRKSADQMAPIVEDLIKFLDSVSNQLRRGRYPDDKTAHKLATVLRAVADDLDV